MAALPLPLQRFADQPADILRLTHVAGTAVAAGLPSNPVTDLEEPILLNSLIVACSLLGID